MACLSSKLAKFACRLVSILSIMAVTSVAIYILVPVPPVWRIVFVAAAGVVVIVLHLVFRCRKKRVSSDPKRGITEDKELENGITEDEDLENGITEDEELENDLHQLSGLPVRFTYEQLKIATRDFHKKIGQGGFGSVYEGNLQKGDRIAVKRLDPGVASQGKRNFLNEVKIIGSINHVNLVRLIGFCAENLHRLLVFEFMSNGSLDQWIFYKQPQQHPLLDWQTRKTIIMNIAKGLAYLHEESRMRIVHFDIKPQNILLDGNMCAKISDFGLSKLVDRNQSHLETGWRGTPGYMAPEWLSSIVTEKADIYSFGIVVMEIICGRKNVNRSLPSQQGMHLLPLFMKAAKESRLGDMVDRNGQDMQLYSLEVEELMKLAIWCLQSDPKRRPSMSTVVKVLEGTMNVEADLKYSEGEESSSTSSQSAILFL